MPMNRKNLLRAIKVLAAAAMLLTLVAASRARAQVVLPLSSAGAPSFGVCERGVLGYPSPTNGVTVTIRPGLTEYRDTDDFFARVPFAKGSRYGRTDCFDGTTQPGRS
jgi:hypothetical protein